MQVLVFDLVGKMAHFRKYYANNTAMSFSVPPRTTLMGVLAAMLGLPRDSYYEALGRQHLRLGVGVRSPLKKSFHRLNFLKVEASRDLDGSKGRIQLPFEIVTGYDLTRDLVRYRVYVAPTKSGQPVFDQLVGQLMTGSGPHFALSLGTANFLATLENVQLHQQARPTTSQEVLEFHSTVPTDRIQHLPSTLTGGVALSLEEELLPADFMGDYQRELVAMNRVLFSTDGQPLRAQVTGEYLELHEYGEMQRLLFLE
jgi:CRISPR-associated protein Cas5h